MRERGITEEDVEQALNANPRKVRGAQRLCLATHQPIRVTLGDLIFVLTAGFGPFDVSIVTIVHRNEDRQPTER